MLIALALLGLPALTLAGCAVDLSSNEAGEADAVEGNNGVPDVGDAGDGRPDDAGGLDDGGEGPDVDDHDVTDPIAVDGGETDAEADGGDDGPTCRDLDGDGARGQGLTCDVFADDYDCDEYDASRFPGAPELCNGVDDDCDGQVDEDSGNVCGGCDPLPEQPGQVCGECGRVVCDGTDGVSCDEGAGNACGGCGMLEGVPGTACGQCGQWRCTGADTVECDDPGTNACGGCGDLQAEVGGSCGTCGDGAWQCEGTSLRCIGAGATTRYLRDGDGDGYGKDGDFQDLCAPQAPYHAAVGGDCDDNVEAINPDADEVCDATDNDCDDQVDEGVKNACGGCAALTGQPGAACGTCGDGAWECAGADRVRCVGTGINACGGCDDLAHDVGDPCGQCGAYTCHATDPNRVVCDDPGANACGGCGALDGTVGASCGQCGTAVCDGQNAVACDDPGTNACGGCAALNATPGAACGECGAYVCNGANQVRCDDPGTNACGGCATLNATPNTSCGECGTRACSGLNSVTCDDPGANACGGCSTLSASPGASCGQCGAYVCNGTEAVTCDDPGLNACGGCAALSDAPGTSCGACGTRECSGADSVTCNNPDATRYWHDGDRDGYGSPTYLDLCAPSGNYDADNGDDCNDSDADIHPNNTESCDTKDNDCDSSVDEGFGLCGANQICSGGLCVCLGTWCGDRCCPECTECGGAGFCRPVICQ